MTLYKRGKTWYMDIRIGNERINRSTGQRKKGDALLVEKAEWKRLIELQATKALNSACREIVTLSKAADRMLEERWKRKKDGHHMWKTVQYVCNEYENPTLDKVTAKWISNLRKWLYRNPDGKKERATATVNRYLAHIRKVLISARDEWEILEKVPKVVLEKESNSRTRVISRDEQEKLTSLLKAKKVKLRPYDPDVADLIDFLCDTGLRLGEALGLSERNFVREGIIQLFPDETKSRATRTVPMTWRVQKVVERRGKSPFDGIDGWKSQRSFNWAKKQLKIDDKEFCLHACRHTFASRLLESGASLYDVKELLGHADFSTTQKYSHLAVGHLQKTIDNLRI